MISMFARLQRASSYFSTTLPHTYHNINLTSNRRRINELWVTQPPFPCVAPSRFQIDIVFTTPALAIAQFCGQTVLIGCVKCGRGGGGCQKSRNFCGRPLCMVPYSSSLSAARAVRTQSMGRFYQADVKSLKENRSFCNSELCTGIPAGLGAWVQNTWHGTHQGNLPRPWPRSDSLVI